jgi:hypothetical protein
MKQVNHKRLLILSIFLLGIILSTYSVFIYYRFDSLFDSNNFIILLSGIFLCLSNIATTYYLYKRASNLKN